ncbi:hypothetical protein Agub_g10979, partial [Astrephomene gubernaculifera]
EEYRDLLRMMLLEGGRLVLLWGVRLNSVDGVWCQTLQIWDVLSVPKKAKALLQWVRRIQAEYDTSTEEHLDALRWLNPPDSEGVCVPRRWPQGLNFARTRRTS